MGFDDALVWLASALTWMAQEVWTPILTRLMGLYAFLGAEKLLLDGVEGEVLAAVNAMGLGLLSATVALWGTPLGARSVESGILEQAHLVRTMYRHALFDAMFWFGAFCAPSAFLQLLDRARSTCESNGCASSPWLVLATNITLIGMLVGAVILFVRARPALLIDARARRATQAPPAPAG